MLRDHVAAAETERRPGLTRRALLTAGAVAGGGLWLAVTFPSGPRPAQAAADAFTPNAFVQIGRDGRATLTVPQVEMGQGIYTALAMLIAEELEIDLAHVQVAHAPPSDKLYANPLLGFQATGGSTSVMGFYKPLREAGAAARMMLVAAAADTWNVAPNTCRAENGAVVDTAGNRRLGYGELVDKAATMPVPAALDLKQPDRFTLIGTPTKRLDTPGKVNGTAVYGIDIRLPGMKVATVAACPVFGGKLASVDDTAAKAVKGVRQIVTLDNAVAVVADHMGAARKGLDALKITWDEGPNARVSSASLLLDIAAAVERPGVVGRKEGDVEAALKGAAKTVVADYQVPFLAHAAMEPLNCTVHVQKDKCEIWLGSQVLTRAQATAAEVTGLPLDRVVVHNQFLGGGFGRRLEVDSVTQAVKIAQQVEGPVKVIWTREEDIQHDIYRPFYYDRMTAGLDASGMPVAFHHRTAGSSIVARWVPGYFKNNLDFDAVEAAAGPYDFPNLLVDWVRHEPPAGMSTGWWRGVGVTHNAFMVEGFVDELAVAAGKDPVAYRLSLLGKAPRAAAALKLAAEKSGWGTPMPAGSGRGVSVIFGFGSYVAQVAEVTVGKDGTVRVTRVVCTVDCGITVNPDTVVAQMQGGIMFGLTAALYGEITLKDGRVEQSNFDTYLPLRIDEAPKVEVHLIRSGEAPGGIGEPGTATLAPAVVNAIFAATGKRLRKLPIDTAALKSA